MLQSHRDLILNYFHAKKEYSSGVVEVLNTKVKLVTRNTYGYRMAATIKTTWRPTSRASPSAAGPAAMGTAASDSPIWRVRSFANRSRRRGTRR